MLFRSLGSMKDFERAATSLRSSALLKPDSLQTQYLLGLVLLDCEKFQGACDAFSETVRIKPDFAEGHYMLGYICLEKLFDEEKGAHHLTKAEKLYVKLEDLDRLERVRVMLEKRGEGANTCGQEHPRSKKHHI